MLSVKEPVRRLPSLRGGNLTVSAVIASTPSGNAAKASTKGRRGSLVRPLNRGMPQLRESSGGLLEETVLPRCSLKRVALGPGFRFN
jgi:hypothetical protein